MISGRSLLKKYWEEARNRTSIFFFAPACPICETPLLWRDEWFLCRDCRERMRRKEGHHCRFCGKFMAGETTVCGECAIARPPFLCHRSFAAYEDPMKRAIHSYKYRAIEPLKRILAAYLMELVAHEIDRKIDAVTAIPPDPGRHRPFHPTIELARTLAKKTAIPFRPDLLRKAVSTPPQVSLNRKDRREGLKMAFVVPATASVKGKTILLIDDVYTTGTTMKVCAAALSRKGGRVIGLTLAQSTWGEDESD